MVSFKSRAFKIEWKITKKDFYSQTLLIFYLLILSFDQSTAQCPNRCNCSPSNTVTCGPGLTVFPANVPTSTTVFSIGVSSSGSTQMDSIPSLSSSNFGSFSNVVRIRIASCNVQTIAPGTFSTLSRLVKLDLKGNKITRLSRSVFTGLTSLEHLVLTDNVGCQLDQDVFEDLTSLKILELGGLGLTSLNILTKMSSLQNLDLHSNNLVRLEYASFVNLNNLKHLDVSFNDLYEIQKGLQSILSNMYSLKLDYNPWRCNCALTWVKSLPAKFVAPSHSGNGLICDQPQKLKHQDLINVADKDMKCVPARVLSCNYPMTVPDGHSIDISCDVEGDPFPVVTFVLPDGSNVSTVLMSSPRGIVNFSIQASVYAQHNGAWSLIAENFNGSNVKTININVATTTTLSTSTTDTTPTTPTTTDIVTVIPTNVATSGSNQVSSLPGNAQHTKTPHKSTNIHSSPSSLIVKPNTSASTSSNPSNSTDSTTNLDSIKIVLIVAASMSGGVFLTGICLFAFVVYKSKKKVRISAKRRSVYSRSDDPELSSNADKPSPTVHDIIYFKEY